MEPAWVLRFVFDRMIAHHGYLDLPAFTPECAEGIYL